MDSARGSISQCDRSPSLPREYRAGEQSIHLRPDELLQMFGRAGRRGMDDRGFVLTNPGKPRLNEAVPLRVRRRNQVDWAVFLHLMSKSQEMGSQPVAQTRRLSTRLFSDQRVPLGLVDFLEKYKHAKPEEIQARRGSSSLRKPISSAGR